MKIWKYIIIYIVFCFSYKVQSQVTLSDIYSRDTRTASMTLLSQQEIDSIFQPANGFYCLNTSTNCINYYLNNKWYAMCGNCVPEIPILSIDSIIIDKQDVVIKFGSNQNSKDIEVYAILLPDSIEQYTLSREIKFIDIPTLGDKQIVYFTKNICGRSTLFFSKIFKVEGKDMCDGLEVQLGESIIPIQSLSDYCWTTMDIKNIDNVQSKYFYKYNENIYYHHNVISQQVHVCPLGFHIPSEREASDLISYFSKNKNRIIKFSPSKKGSYLKEEGGIINYGKFSAYWINDKVKSRVLVVNENGGMIVDVSDKKDAYVSIRCVKD